MDGPTFSAGTGGWDYRAVAVTTGAQATFAIFEVYYDETGAPVARTDQPSAPHGQTLADLRQDFDRMTEAFLQPTLVDQGGRLRTADDTSGSDGARV